MNKNVNIRLSKENGWFTAVIDGIDEKITEVSPEALAITVYDASGKLTKNDNWEVSLDAISLSKYNGDEKKFLDTLQELQGK